MSDFAGKTVMITGSRRGIGRAMLKAFAKSGANIIAHARKPDEDFETSIQSEANIYGVKITPVYFDLTEYETMKQEVKKILKEVVPDILINNAGIAHIGLLQMTPIKKIKDVFENNIFSMMALTQLILPGMIRRKTGNILNIASISGIYLKPGNSAYGVSKAAVIAWTKGMAAEIGPLGLRMNALAPGTVETDLGHCMQTASKDGKMFNSALRRNAVPEEIANVACFVVSEEASYMNGAIVNIDGGVII